VIFVRRHRGPSGYHDEVFHDDEHVVRTLTKLLDDSASAHRSLDPAEGLQDAQLDDGARVHIAHGDITRGGHVLVNIRKFTGIPFRSLDELVKRGMLSGQVAGLLIACRAPTYRARTRTSVTPRAGRQRAALPRPPNPTTRPGDLPVAWRRGPGRASASHAGV
jgi:pilus assembly protein CpaF